MMPVRSNCSQQGREISRRSKPVAVSRRAAMNLSSGTIAAPLIAHRPPGRPTSYPLLGVAVFVAGVVVEAIVVFPATGFSGAAVLIYILRVIRNPQAVQKVSRDPAAKQNFIVPQTSAHR